MGVRPKSLIEVGGQPLLARIGQALRGAGIRPLVVVLGGPHAEVLQSVADITADDVVRNPQAAQGQGTSVLCGLSAVVARTQAIDGVLVALADQPLLTAADIGDLVRAFCRRGPMVQMVVPRCQGRPGNPVIIDAALARQWLADGASAVGQRWRAANPERVHWWDTDTDHFVQDLDEPADLARCAERLDASVQWPARWRRPGDPH